MPHRAASEKRDTSNADILVLEHWRAFGVHAGLAGVTNRVDYRVHDGGRSTGAWTHLANELDAASLVVSRQPHGKQVAVHQNLSPGVSVLDGFDGHITDQVGSYLAVTVADCIPVYLRSSVGPTVAVLHAGWRGIAAGIIEAGIARFTAVSGSSHTDVVMHCGISICGACYEVGPEVWQALGRPAPTAPRPLDLREIVVDRALSSGLRDVTTSPACTAHDGLPSHRARGTAAGRMAAFVGLPRLDGRARRR